MIPQLLQPHIETLSIQSVHVAPEALECAVALTSGEIVVYHSATSTMGLSPSKATDVVLLDHIRPTPGRRPYFMLNPNRGLIAICAISDTGSFILSIKVTDV
jgi:syntaxin-binding protein 5